jgi:SAM-dependent methyltransferase
MFHPNGPTLGELFRQGLSSTERGYDLLAPKFEYTPFRTPDAVLEVAAQRIAAGPRVARALDLACGTGAALRHLLPHVEGAAVGLDRSAGMLAEGRRAPAPLPGGAKVHWARGDLLHLPFAASFDLVVCFGAFGHVLERDEPALVAQIHRALRPGGRFVFATGDVPSPLAPAVLLARGFNAAMRVRNALLKPEFVMYYLTFMLPRAQQLLRAQGFEVEVERELFPHPYRKLVLVTATRR